MKEMLIITRINRFNNWKNKKRIFLKFNYDIKTFILKLYIFNCIVNFSFLNFCHIGYIDGRVYIKRIECTKE